MQSKPGTPLLRIGTRGSPLAMAQAREVQRRLCDAHDCDPGEIEIVEIAVSGDQMLDRALKDIGGKGLFTKEIEDQLADGRIDIAVHSSKDMPTSLPDGLTLSTFLEREDVRDAFLSLSVGRFAALPEGARLGTSSLRRAAQMRRHRPDLEIVGFRGNVGTRLKKLADGIADATLLAVAGLNRLGMDDKITEILDPERFPPAPAQGAICIEQRTNDARVADLLKPLNHAGTASALAAERAFLAALDGSCRTPIGAYTTRAGNELTLLGEILSPDGAQAFRARFSAPVSDAAQMGAALGAEIRHQAGPDFFAMLAAG